MKLRFTNVPKNGILILIKIYQRTLSFDHGPLKIFKPQGACKFRPTCSEYIYDAVKKYGAFKGLFKGVNRLRRCHPWSDGGYDPVK